MNFFTRLGAVSAEVSSLAPPASAAQVCLAREKDLAVVRALICPELRVLGSMCVTLVLRAVAGRVRDQLQFQYHLCMQVMAALVKRAAYAWYKGCEAAFPSLLLPQLLQLGAETCLVERMLGQLVRQPVDKLFKAIRHHVANHVRSVSQSVSCLAMTQVCVHSASCISHHTSRSLSWKQSIFNVAGWAGPCTEFGRQQ